MEDKLVTIAIHTFEKAQMLKMLLESENIEVYIHNVNQIQPVVSSGVRVRIKESDLPHALRIIEDNNKWLEGEKDKEEGHIKGHKKILIPIDFSEYSIKACEIGFNYAGKINAEIVILHAYYSPYFPSAVPFGDTLAYKTEECESEHIMIEHINMDMNQFCIHLKKLIEEKKLPDVKFESVIREGLPEEEIIAYGKEYRPDIIIMGTRGKDQKDLDLIGSVTGEIIELSRVPVLAIPENIPYKDLSEVKKVAFATSFTQHDLLVFDAFMEVLKPYHPDIYLFNISTSHNDWNEIRLTGVNEYFKKQYPEASITHKVLADGDLLLAIEKFVRDNQIDMISFSTLPRNVISRMFNPSIARRMLFHTDTPMLVMHI